MSVSTNHISITYNTPKGVTTQMSIHVWTDKYNVEYPSMEYYSVMKINAVVTNATI